MTKAYTPHLFIDIGATSAFYTLRETYIREQWVGGQSGHMHREESSFHHFNLSQDAGEAFAKAQAYADRVQLVLAGSIDDIEQKMRTIQRATAAEMEARRQHYEQLRQERLAERAEKAATWRAENAELVAWLEERRAAGESDEFVMSMVESLSAWGSLTTGQERAASAAMTRRRQATISKHIGEPGNRMHTMVRVTASRHISTDDRFYPPRRRYLVTLEDQAGNVLTWWASHGEQVFDLHEPASFTVKEHDEYRGVKQTVIQRLTFKQQAVAA